jgi:hypothetical protein
MEKGDGIGVLWCTEERRVKSEVRRKRMKHQAEEQKERREGKNEAKSEGDERSEEGSQVCEGFIYILRSSRFRCLMLAE